MQTLPMELFLEREEVSQVQFIQVLRAGAPPEDPAGGEALLGGSVKAPATESTPTGVWGKEPAQATSHLPANHVWA